MPSITQHQPFTLSGARNCRGLDGYTTSQGQRIKPGPLYRSGALAHASPRALQALREQLKINLVVDLRRPDERDRQPNPDIGAETMQVCVVPEGTTHLWEMFQRGELSRQYCYDFMLNYYRLLTEETAAQGYRDILAKLLEQRGPMLFHCSAGKDRTGYLAAIIKLALDVPDEQVMQDYLLSNNLIDLEEDVLKHLLQTEEMPKDTDWDPMLPLLRVHTEYLEEALRAMRDSCGSVQGYLHEALGLNEAKVGKLRKYLLQEHG